MGSESTPGSLSLGAVFFPRRGGFGSLASVVPPSGFPWFRSCLETDLLSGGFLSAGSRLDSLVSEVPPGLGFGLDFQCGCGVEESFVLLSREVERVVEGVSRPPAVSNLGALAGCGFFLGWFESSLGLRKRRGFPEGFRSFLSRWRGDSFVWGVCKVSGSSMQWVDVSEMVAGDAVAVVVVDGSG